MRRSAIAVLLCLPALLYTLHGFLPGRVLVPADIPRDYLAWKHDPATRVRVSNSLLSDVVLQFIPWDVEATRQLQSGAFPWRNRFAGDGAPLFANPQTALLSPFTWPRVIFGLDGWAWTVLLKLLAAAAGMYWLARSLAIPGAEACVSAAVFAWCGFTTTLALHPHTNVFVILPALCAAVISRSHPVVIVALAALATAGGHPETLFIGVLSIALFLGWNRQLRWNAVAAACAGFLLLAVQVVPFAVAMWRSHARVARSVELPAYFHWPSLVSLILPGAFGSPLRGELDMTAFIPYGENFVTRTLPYVGLLILFAIVASWRQLPAAVRRGLIIGTAGLLLAMWIPGVRDVMRRIPVIDWIAFDWFAIPFALFASLAAGPACFAIARAGARRIAIVLAAGGILLVIAGALPAIAPDLLQRAAARGIEVLQHRGHLHQAPAVYEARLASYLAAAKWTALRRALLPGFCWIVFAVGLRTRRAAIVSIAALAELAFFGYGFVPSIHTGEIAPRPAFIAALDRRFFIASSPDAFPANLGTWYGVRQIDSYDVLTSESETRNLERAGYDPFMHVFGEPHPGALGSLGVRYWIDARGVTTIANVRYPSPPQTGPPPGSVAGVVLSAFGLLLAIVVTRYSHSIVAGGLDETS